MKKITLLVLGSVALLAAGATTSYAHENACSSDLQKFCPKADNWKDKGACLKQNESALSTACSQARAKRKAKWEAIKAEFHKACDADIKKSCSNVSSDDKGDGKGKPGEVFRCLKNNESSLSDSCKAELDKMHKHHHHHES